MAFNLCSDSDLSDRFGLLLLLVSFKNVHNGGGGSSVRKGTWRGNWRAECGLEAGEVLVHLLGTAKVPLSKAPSP